MGTHFKGMNPMKAGFVPAGLPREKVFVYMHTLIIKGQAKIKIHINFHCLTSLIIGNANQNFIGSL